MIELISTNYQSSITSRLAVTDSPDTVQFVAALFTDDLSEWWADSGSRLPINSITDLIQNIKGSFTLKDFEGENLKALMRVCQEGNTQQSLTGFIKAFNEYSNDWKNDITFKSSKADDSSIIDPG